MCKIEKFHILNLFEKNAHNNAHWSKTNDPLTANSGMDNIMQTI